VILWFFFFLFYVSFSDLWIFFVWVSVEAHEASELAGLTSWLCCDFETVVCYVVVVCKYLVGWVSVPEWG
jgi:hypothetical protein